MSASKTSGHFWPAYVDLMTVLLMVFLLLTMLFQVVAGAARMQEGLKVSQAASIQAAKATEQKNTLQLSFASIEAPLSASDIAKVNAWFRENADDIKVHGCTLRAVVTAEQSEVGRRLSSQFGRLLEIKKLATELGIDQQKFQIVNRLDNATEAMHGAIRLSVGQ